MGRVEGGELLLRVHEFMLDKLRERMKFTVNTPRRRSKLLENRHRFDHVVAGGGITLPQQSLAIQARRVSRIFSYRSWRPSSCWRPSFQADPAGLGITGLNLGQMHSNVQKSARTG